MDDRTDDLRDEYNLDELLRGAERGKYASRYAAGTNLVLLDPDVALAFPDSDSVNAALRILMDAAARARAVRD